jgi:NCAIR mutase (PurE)-related protein
MNLDQILAAFKNGALAAEEVKSQIQNSNLQEMEDVVLDLKREERCGLPEVVYGHSKTVDQILTAAVAILENSDSLLITRVKADKASEIMSQLEGCKYSKEAECVYKLPQKKLKGRVLVITAGTSDVRVAREAELVCQMFGLEVTVKPDLGVAALNRILSIKDELLRADSIIVCAGMEAALPSVVGGLVSVPVIAVPVSSGYGSSMGGFTALLGMLNSCTSGLTVVNIDNGFGAGYAAGRIMLMLNSGSD